MKTWDKPQKQATRTHSINFGVLGDYETEERAAILEYCAGYDKATAERKSVEMRKGKGDK